MNDIFEDLLDIVNGGDKIEAAKYGMTVEEHKRAKFMQKKFGFPIKRKDEDAKDDDRS